MASRSSVGSVVGLMVVSIGARLESAGVDRRVDTSADSSSAKATCWPSQAVAACSATGVPARLNAKIAWWASTARRPRVSRPSAASRTSWRPASSNAATRSGQPGSVLSALGGVGVHQAPHGCDSRRAAVPGRRFDRGPEAREFRPDVTDLERIKARCAVHGGQQQDTAALWHSGCRTRPRLRGCQRRTLGGRCPCRRGRRTRRFRARRFRRPSRWPGGRRRGGPADRPRSVRCAGVAFRPCARSGTAGRDSAADSTSAAFGLTPASPGNAT